MKKIVSLALTLLAGAASAGLWPFGGGCVEIVRDGAAASAIVSNGNTEAADFLKTYLEKITGRSIPLVVSEKEACGLSKIVLEIGEVPTSGDADLDRQSYTLKTSGKTLRIVSPDKLGLYYAVSGLLQDHFGVRFFTSTCEKVPRNASPVLEDIDELKRPSFKMRGYVTPPVRPGLKDHAHTIWWRRNFGGGYPFEWISSGHTFYRWTKMAENQKEHPEWLSMSRTGQRTYNWEYGVCGTNKELAKELADNLIEAYEKNVADAKKRKRAFTPRDTIFPIAQGDGFAPCYCPECRKLVAEEESEAAPQTLLFNRALEIACKKYPDIKIITYAYFGTLPPPKKMEIHPNLWVCIVSSSLSMNESGDQINEIETTPENRDYAQSIREWGKRIPGRISIYHWDGVDGGNSEYSEWPNVLAHARDIKFWAKNNVGCPMKAGGPRPNWGWLTEWLWFQMMRDATQDENKLCEEFLRGYYGDAAGAVLWEYFQYLEKLRADVKYGCPTVRWSSWAPIMLDKYYPEPIRREMDAYLNRAIEAAKTSSDPAHLSRVLNAKATSVDQLFINASKAKDYVRVTDPVTGKPWYVHGGDITLPARITRLGDYAYNMDGWFHPGVRRTWVVQNEGGEAVILRDGKDEAAVVTDIRGQIYDCRINGIDVFAPSSSILGGYRDEVTGRTKTWSLLSSDETKAENKAIVSPIEWCMGWNHLRFYRTASLKDGALVIERRFEQGSGKDGKADFPSITKMSRNTRFSAVWALKMPSAENAGAAIEGGGIRRAVTFASAVKGNIDAKDAKRAADRLGADCQNPLFDEVSELSVTDMKFPFKSKNGEIKMQISRGDGVVVEIRTPADGWEAVSFKPDAERGVVEVTLTSVVHGDLCDGKAKVRALPKTVMTVRGKARHVPAKRVKVEKPRVAKIRLTGENTAVNTADGAELIRIPAGAFWRGSNDGPRDERPMRRIDLDEYWIYKYPVKLSMYEKFYEEVNPSNKFRRVWGQTMADDLKKPAGGYPVLLSWNEADGYAKHVGGYLPTEAQWEKAARGDKDARVYPWGDKWESWRVSSMENTVKIGGTGTMRMSEAHPDGVSPYGVWDMCGNNFEWVSDWYAWDYFAKSPPTNPRGPESGVNKVMKGGDSMHSETKARISYRYLCEPNRRDFLKVGFRVVLENPEIEK